MRYALFLGCTAPVRAQNYELAVRNVARCLDIEPVDMEDFACCGFPLKSVDESLTHLLAARNLAIASQAGLDILTLCSACTGALTEVKERLKDSDFQTKINKELKKTGRVYNKKIAVKHFVRALYEDFGLEKLKQRVKKRLSGLRLAAHYGCHYLKPSELYKGFDNPEFPRSLDELISITGASYVNYENKRFCCGGAILGIDENVALKMAKTKLDSVVKEGVDGLISICPFCSVMYEDNQRKIESRLGSSYNLPVLYYPQLLGLALGLGINELGLKLNKIKLDSLLAKCQ